MLMLVQLRRLDWFHLVFNSKMYIFKSDINLNKSNVRQLDDEIADLAFQMQYESWTWRTETTFHAFKLGLDWVLMVLMSLIFRSKKFLVFLVSFLVFLHHTLVYTHNDTCIYILLYTCTRCILYIYTYIHANT